MKYILIAIFLFITVNTYAQFTSDQLYGIWVKTKVTYKDGSGLGDDDPIKYAYVKYVFSAPNDVNLAMLYDDSGGNYSFYVNDNELTIKSPLGYFINSFHIEGIKDTLVLLQYGNQGRDDPYTLKYYFVPEKVYKNSIPLKQRDIYSIRIGDTIYNESPKIYPSYKGKNFQSDIYSGIAETIGMNNRAGHFIAVFTIFKSGIADSLKILQGIDDDFNKRFIKIFNRSRKNWKPATLNGRPVNVEMKVFLTYLTSDAVLPANRYIAEAKNAYSDKKYDLASHFYDLALKADPNNKSALYRQGLCKMILGDKAGACENWNKISELGGSPESDAMLEKFCN